MYRFTAILILITISFPAFASGSVITQKPYYNSYYGAYWGGDYIPSRRYMTKNNYSRFSDINELERYAMNKNFTKDSDITRLERLETLAFGAVRQGDIYTRYDNVREAILTRPKQDYKRSLMRNISDYFMGRLTGYTPSINQEDSDMVFPDSSFGKNYATNYVTPYGRGYKTNNYGMESGMGVRILD